MLHLLVLQESHRSLLAMERLVWGHMKREQFHHFRAQLLLQARTLTCSAISTMLSRVFLGAEMGTRLLMLCAYSCLVEAPVIVVKREVR